jgi:hypothetical protein
VVYVSIVILSNLHPGQDATIKLSAYDFSTYGGLKGRVEQISPGALKDDEARHRPGAETPYYRAMVRTHGNSLSKGGSQELRIVPDMTATVDILTGRKTRLDCLLQPILRVQEAFRENQTYPPTNPDYSKLGGELSESVLYQWTLGYRTHRFPLEGCLFRRKTARRGL